MSNLIALRNQVVELRGKIQSKRLLLPKDTAAYYKCTQMINETHQISAKISGLMRYLNNAEQLYKDVAYLESLVEKM